MLVTCPLWQASSLLTYNVTVVQAGPVPAKPQTVLPLTRQIWQQLIPLLQCQSKHQRCNSVV